MAPQPGEHVVFGSTSPTKDCSWSFGTLITGSMTLLSGYQGIVTWSSFLNQISGELKVEGGTFTSTNIEFKLGGNLSQTGGVFSMVQGTMTFNGASSQTVRVTSSALFNEVHVLGGRIWAVESDMNINGNLKVEPAMTMTLAAGTTLFAAGDIDVDPAVTVVVSTSHTILLDGSANRIFQISKIGQLRVRPGATGSLPTGFEMTASSRVIIDAGGTFNAISAVFRSSGDWVNNGNFDNTGGTIAFGASNATRTIIAGGSLFGTFILDVKGATVQLSTHSTILGDVLINNGILDLGISTHRVRGDWVESSSGIVRGSTSVVVFDGTTATQTVTQITGSLFHTLISSNIGAVRFSTHTRMTGSLELHNGQLNFSTVSVLIGGDLFARGGDQPRVEGSTVTLNGSGSQRLDFGNPPLSLDSLVIVNTSTGVSLDSSLMLDRNFTISTGAVVFGSSGTLRMRGGGATLDAFGALYTSTGPLGHRLELMPPSGQALFIAAGSSIGASVDVLGDTILLGDLFLDGTAEFLTVGSGVSLDAQASTITLFGTTELALAPGSAFLRSTNSWIVFSGSGTDRGLALSTGPIGNLRLAPEDPLTEFRFQNLALDGSFVYESGFVRNSTGAVFSVKGDFILDASGFDFASFGSSTVRLDGAALQLASIPVSARFYDFDVAGTSVVTLSTGSSLVVTNELLLTGGTMRAGDATIQLLGDWIGTGGLFVGETSTVSFVNPTTTQTYTDTLTQGLHGLVASSGTRVFMSGFNADLFTALQPATTLQFANGETFTISTLTINGNSLTNPIIIESTAPGSPALFVIGDSTVTAARISDNDASGGIVVFVNDGRSSDAGGVTNWNFTSDLLLIAQGESFVEGVGKVGVPDPQVAGATFTVTVIAVSDEFGSVPASTITVSIVTADLFDLEPGSRSLIAGSTTFDLVLRTAEPGPFNSVVTPVSLDAIGQTGSTIPLNAGAFVRLQSLLPGERPLPGSPGGKEGIADIQIQGFSFATTIRGTDQFWNLVSTTGHGVALSSTTSPLATLPPAQELVGGTTGFDVVLLLSTGIFTITSSPTADASILPVVSSTFPVFEISFTSPTILFDIPNNAIVGTLSGQITGSAADAAAVAAVRVAIQDKTDQRYFNWSAGTFTSLAPDFLRASVSPFRGSNILWKVPFDDSKLIDGRQYFAIAGATNPSKLEGLVETTFTFRSANLLFAPDDGEGIAVLSSTTLAGCGVAFATVTFTVGASGIRAGGAIALKIPNGWTKPVGLAPGASPGVGFVVVNSTSLAWTVPASSPIVFNPPSIGSATLGDNWIVIEVATDAPNSFIVGEEVVITFAAIPPGGVAGSGDQFFDVRTRSDGQGELVSLAATPIVFLTTGPPRGLAFSDPRDLILGSLQEAPTAQILLTDACGNETSASAALTIFLEASIASGTTRTPDLSATFNPSNVGPRNFVSVAAGQSRSEGFYYTTSTTTLTAEVLVATATVNGERVEAVRRISLRATAASFSGVSIDTGTLTAGSTSINLTPGSGERIFVRVTLPAGPLEWSVALGTATGFETAHLLRAGSAEGGESLSITFDPVRCDSFVCRHLPPGRYPIRIRSGGGTLEDRSLEVRVATSPFIFGDLGATGAGAIVRVDGPGPGSGRFDRATSTGYFEIRGLIAGESYAVYATTQSFVQGFSLQLSTGIGGITALSVGTDAGSFGFENLGTLRVSIGIPVPAPTELFGGLTVEANDASRRVFGSLHYAKGAARSDDGRQILGVDASTWTVLSLPAGNYNASVELASLGISSTILGIAIAAGQSTDLPVTLFPRANLFGRVILPSTPTVGTFVAVQAIADGDIIPSVFGGAFVAAPSQGVVFTSATYSLFGLTPGSWTIRGEGRALRSTSTVLFVAGTADIGDSLTGLGGLDLNLELGSVLVGSVTVVGNTTGLGSSGETDLSALGLTAPANQFFVLVDAYNPATFARVGTVVVMTTAAAQSVATFTITGLDPGEHWVGSSLIGFRKDPAGVERIIVSTLTNARADIFFRTNEARARFSVQTKMPSAPCSCAADFDSVGVFLSAPDGSARVVSDVTTLDGVDGSSFSYFESSFSFLTPSLPSGFHRFSFRDSSTGAAADAVVAVALGSTATATISLDASTAPVSGSLSFSGAARFLREGFSVTVSSIPGLLAQGTTTSYCLLATTAPVVLDGLHVELVPIERSVSADAGALLRSTSTNCADFTLSASSAALSPALLAHTASIAADGSFSFGGVSPGVYRLRIPGDLDLASVNGNEIAPLHSLVRVTTGSVVNLRLRGGSKVSGIIRAPEGIAPDRTVALSLMDAEGSEAAATVVAFNQSRTRAFALDAVADGEYTLLTRDLGTREILTAKPQRVVVGGEDVAAIEVLLLQGGFIIGRMAVEQRRPDGTRSFVAVTRDNRELLPPGMRVVGNANPWKEGGFKAARGEDCTADGCALLSIDANGQFIIPAMLPGTYDIEFNIRNGRENTAQGSLDLVSTVRSGLVVTAGRATDAGIVRLLAGVSVSGTVVDAQTGAVVPNIGIRAIPSAGVPGTGSRRRVHPASETNSSGVYEIRGLDPAVGVYDFIAAPRSGDVSGVKARPYASVRAPSINILSTATLDFSLLPVSFAVTGIIVTEDGGALESSGERAAETGALLRLRQDGIAQLDEALGDLRQRTFPDGRFSIPYLPLGTYRLSVFADGYGQKSIAVSISSASVNLGTITLTRGASLVGSIRNSDGTAPGEDEIAELFAVTPNVSSTLFGSLVRDPNTRTITGYRISGLDPGTGYRILFKTISGEVISPVQGRFVTAVSSVEVRTLDLVFQRDPPAVFAKSRRNGTDFLLTFDTSHALRARKSSDDLLTLIVSTVMGTGALSELTLTSDRRRISATYTPIVGESSFTLRFQAFSALRNPLSSDLNNPEFLIFSTFTFFPGLDGYSEVSIPNLTGGNVSLEDDPGRVTIPEGAFFVDASSSVRVALEHSNELLVDAASLASLGYTPAGANLKALRYSAQNYPAEIRSAMAATPPTVIPKSSFYDVLLPPGVPRSLAKPAQLTLKYAAGTNPADLKVFWYNTAANAYVLQEDVTGRGNQVNTGVRTITINVDHFSTFVLFDSGAAVISGNQFSGGDIEAFNFPNPFDLNQKTVTPIHGIPARTIRGTLIRFAVPLAVSGAASIRIFTLTGKLIRTIDLGNLSGGQFYYQAWDGRNDATENAASGVYIAQIKVGGQSTFFKMALIK